MADEGVRPTLARSGTSRHSPLLGAQQVREQAVGAGNAGGQLAEPHVGGVDEDALTVARPQFAALQRLFAGIVRGEHCFVARVPLRQKVRPPLLNPALEIARPALVWL